MLGQLDLGSMEDQGTVPGAYLTELLGMFGKIVRFHLFTLLAVACVQFQDSDQAEAVRTSFLCGGGKGGGRHTGSRLRGSTGEEGIAFVSRFVSMVVEGGGSCTAKDMQIPPSDLVNAVQRVNAVHSDRQVLYKLAKEEHC